MKKKLLVINFVVFLFLISSVFALNETFDITNQVNQPNSEIVIPQGQDAVASLPLFSKTYLRIYEGSKVDFNIVDPDTGVTLISNSIIIKEIAQDLTKVSLSVDGKQYEDTVLYPGKDLKLNYTYKFAPFIILKQIITHYEADPSKRSIVLFFNEPFLKAGKKLDMGVEANPSTVLLDTSNIQSNNEDKGPSLVVLFLIIIIAVLVIAIIYIKKIRK